MPSTNYYHATGKAVVRNIRLPSWYKHGAIPDNTHLLRSQAIRDWINHYHPSSEPISTPELDAQFEGDSTNILWAAEVWHSIKKHWVIELQRNLRVQRGLVSVGIRKQ